LGKEVVGRQQAANKKAETDESAAANAKETDEFSQTESTVGSAFAPDNADM
jgi:hypothetical protein